MAHIHDTYVTEIVRLMKDVSSQNLGLLLDVGHLNVSASALGYERENFIAIQVGDLKELSAEKVFKYFEKHI